MSRPRNAENDSAVIAAATRQLLEKGFERLSVNDVAAEARVAKTTVYRRWPTKAHLVVAVVASMHSEVHIHDSGDVVADISALVGELSVTLEEPLIRSIAAELAAAASRDTDLRTQFSALWAARRAELERVIRSAIARGDMVDTDPALVIDQLIGPLYYRILITGEPINPAYASDLVSTVLRGLVPQRDIAPNGGASA
jgi:AcrR family transcriptional regulator